VLLLCGELDAGGTQRVVANLARGLNDRGHRVVVATFCDGGTDFFRLPPVIGRARMRDSGRTVVATTHRTLRGRVSRIAGNLPHRAQRLLATRATTWAMAAYLRRLDRIRWIRDTIEAHGPATVVSFGPGANVAALIAARGLPCRVVVSERNDVERHSIDFLLATLCRRLYTGADVVTANSHGTLAGLARWVPPDRLAYVPNPLAIPDGARSGPAPSGFAGPCVLTVARLVEQKEHTVLLDAFARLPSGLDHWRLAVVGSGPEEQALRRQADRLGIADRVDWYGRCDDPYAFYRHADVFALPSRFEGMPNALLEAMSFGLPAIVADGTPGPLEVVHHGETGLVTAGGDPEALASAITLLATRPDLRRALGESARREVRRFAMAEAVGAWAAVLALPDRVAVAEEPIA
jgi:glycosyltransferase involved in cell wall biosynthesis